MLGRYPLEIREAVDFSAMYFQAYYWAACATIVSFARCTAEAPSNSVGGCDRRHFPSICSSRDIGRRWSTRPALHPRPVRTRGRRKCGT